MHIDISNRSVFAFRVSVILLRKHEFHCVYLNNIIPSASVHESENIYTRKSKNISSF